MGVIVKLKRFINEYFFNEKWCCNVCGKEIFNDKYFCDECEKTLPYNDGHVCEHCGRKVIAPEPYCSTCKGALTSLDKCRSAFVYQKPINHLIQNAKYNGNKYLLKAFADYLAPLYFKNYFNADYLCFVPMTKQAIDKRGYNQSEELARFLSKKVNVPVLDCLTKTKDTQRQAQLTKMQRLKNLIGVFRVSKRKAIKDKTLLLIDDVTTTGSTAEVIASALKKAGAQKVYLLSVASVPPRDGY